MRTIKEEVKSMPFAAWLVIGVVVMAIIFSGCKKEEPVPTPPTSPSGPGGTQTEYNDYRIEFEIFDNGLSSKTVGSIMIADSLLISNNGANYNYQTISSGYFYEEILLNNVPDTLNVSAAFHINGMFYAGGWMIDVDDVLSLKIYRNDTLVHSESGFDIGDSNPVWLNN